MKTILLTLVVLLQVAPCGLAQRFVTVGNPGNPAAPADAGNAAGRGNVAMAYRIGRWEVTNREWTVFLNSVATGRVTEADPHGLFDSRMQSDPRGGIIRELNGLTITGYTSKTDMAKKPVNFVSYYDALRYCNWQHNGQSEDPESTEDGAYRMGQASREEENQAFSRRANARFWLPTIDEWAKAAYYRPGNQTWTDYPGASSALPALATATGECSNPAQGRMNFFSAADWDGQNGNVLTVGSCDSSYFYGVYDAGGNVAELVETPAATGGEIYLCGGAFNTSIVPLQLTSLTNYSIARSAADVSTGFRIASTSPAPLWHCQFQWVSGDSEPIRITVPTQIGSQYRIEWSPDLKDWSALNIFFGSGSLHYFQRGPFPGRHAGYFRTVENPVVNNTP